MMSSGDDTSESDKPNECWYRHGPVEWDGPQRYHLSDGEGLSRCRAKITLDAATEEATGPLGKKCKRCAAGEISDGINRRKYRKKKTEEQLAVHDIKPGWEELGNGEEYNPPVGEPGHKSDKTLAEEKRVAAMDPWERQPKETAPAFAAWTMYRDQGYTRSARRVSEDASKNESLIKGWCTRWKWVSRAEAWDIEEDRLYRLDMRRSKRAMNRRHAEAAGRIVDFGLRQLTSQVEDAKTEKEVDKILLSHSDLLRYVLEGAKLERLAHGEAGDIVTNYMSGGNNTDDLETTGPVAIPFTFEKRANEVLGLLDRARERSTLSAISQSRAD